MAFSPGIPDRALDQTNGDQPPNGKKTTLHGRRMLLLTFFTRLTNDGSSPYRELKEALDEEGGQHE
jgi:hypothetical protein